MRIFDDPERMDACRYYRIWGVCLCDDPHEEET